MSTDKILQTVSIGSDATEQLGELVGSRLKGDEVIELISDLGGGKTTFVRGLARGASSEDHVSSPSFTLSKVYKAPQFNIHHFDFHRLSEPGLAAHELKDVLTDPKAVVVIEWGAIVSRILPSKRLIIEIKKEGDERRKLYFNCHPRLEYLTENL